MMSITYTLYSMIKIMIDLILDEFGETNPVLIAELIEEHFDTEVSIFDVINHLEDVEDYSIASRMVKYGVGYE